MILRTLKATEFSLIGKPKNVGKFFVMEMFDKKLIRSRKIRLDLNFAETTTVKNDSARFTIILFTYG